jgi:hypothetical protein
MRRVGPASRTALGLVFAVVSARGAAAQSPQGPGQFDLSAGAAWIGSQSFGSATASETTPTSGALKIFDTTSELGTAFSLQARVGIRVAGALFGEIEGGYARPDLRVAIANDIEGAASSTVSEPVQQYTIGGGATWYVPKAAHRLRPFVTGGGGYLRQLHAGSVLAVTGRYYRFGGGAIYLLAERSDRRLKATGIRIDAGATIYKDGVAFDGGPHTVPAIGASFFVRF